MPVADRNELADVHANRNCDKASGETVLDSVTGLKYPGQTHEVQTAHGQVMLDLLAVQDLSLGLRQAVLPALTQLAMRDVFATLFFASIGL